MFRFGISVVVGLAFLCTAGPTQADDKGKTAKKKERPVHGFVQKVGKEEGKEGIFLVIEVTARKKNESLGAEKQEKRFHILPAAKIEKVTGKKENATRTEMKLDDLKPGQNVIVTTNGGKVEKVEMMLGKKNK